MHNLDFRFDVITH